MDYYEEKKHSGMIHHLILIIAVLYLALESDYSIP